MTKNEYVRWIDPKYPNMPPTWLPINREKGLVVTGHLICNIPPKEGKVIGEMKFTGDPIFSTPEVTFYKEPVVLSKQKCRHPLWVQISPVKAKCKDCEKVIYISKMTLSQRLNLMQTKEEWRKWNER